MQIVSRHVFVAAVLSRVPYGHEEEIRSSQAVSEIVNCRLFVAALRHRGFVVLIGYEQLRRAVID